MRDVVADAPVEKGASLVNCTEDALDVLGPQDARRGLLLDGFKRQSGAVRRARGVVAGGVPVEKRASLVKSAQYAIDVLGAQDGRG